MTTTESASLTYEQLWEVLKLIKSWPSASS